MLIRLVFFLLALPSLSASAREYTSTGFFYPLKNESPNFSSAGRWLERPPPNGHYVASGVYHTGSDMMIPRGAGVYAISDGEVESPSTSGWGGTENVGMRVKHKTIDGRVFRAIYGHVIAEKTPGSQVQAGERIARIGPYACGSNPNCDHLHFGILAAGLPGPVDPSAWGRWADSKYGVQESGYYDNGLIDPIWFITHSVPDNWISRASVDPNSLTLISVTNPWFPQLCGSSFDSRCDSSDVDSYTMCVIENSGLCTPAVKSYSAVNGGGNGSGNAGGGGGVYNLNQDTDIINAATGQEIIAGTKNLVPGQVVNIRVQLISEGGDVRNSIKPGKDRVETDYYVRLGGGNWVFAQRKYTQTSNLAAGTHTETFAYTIPQGVSEISFRVKIDSTNEVTESNEGDNWSRIETFQIDTLAWLIPIL